METCERCGDSTVVLYITDHGDLCANCADIDNRIAYELAS